MRRSGPVPLSSAPPDPGGVQTTFAATASCPSRKTVAVMGTCSPTTARAEKDPHDTRGATSVMPRRRSARAVIPATLSRSGPSSTSAAISSLGAHPVGAAGTDGAPVAVTFPAGSRYRNSSLPSARASTPTVHRPRGAARAPDASVPAGDQPALVVAPRDPGSVRNPRSGPVAALRRRPGEGARRGVGRTAGPAGEGPQVRPPPAGRRRRPPGVPDDAPLVPVARG